MRSLFPPGTLPLSPLPPGVVYRPECLTLIEQQALVEELRNVARKAPFFQPRLPGSGQAFSIKMTNCGPLGWVADRQGYRYQAHHPKTGLPWPAIPERLLELWRDFCGTDFPEPDCCLVNWYGPEAHLGLHRDDGEAADCPILSLSLGRSATFRLGGLKREDPRRALRLNSGDALLLGGESRLVWHGVPRLLKTGADPLALGGRLNLTLRRVRPA